MQNQFRRSTLIPAALLLSGCWSGVAPAGPEERESRSIDLDKSERVRVELKMSAGEIDVRGGAQKLMDADFTYNVPAWKPDIRYKPGAPAGDLIIEQQGKKLSSGHTKNKWELRFNDKVPIDFRAGIGAGEARLNLGSLTLRSVDLEMGAGTLRLDLRGTPTKDYAVNVRGGVGDATVYLPNNVGVSAAASGALGDISVSGLHKSGERYVNDAYELAAVRIRLDVKGGVGSIKLIAE
jgi:predicted membrane protein